MLTTTRPPSATCTAANSLLYRLHRELVSPSARRRCAPATSQTSSIRDSSSAVFPPPPPAAQRASGDEPRSCTSGCSLKVQRRGRLKANSATTDARRCARQGDASRPAARGLRHLSWPGLAHTVPPAYRRERPNVTARTPSTTRAPRAPPPACVRVSRTGIRGVHAPCMAHTARHIQRLPATAACAALSGRSLRLSRPTPRGLRARRRRRRA